MLCTWSGSRWNLHAVSHPTCTCYHITAVPSSNGTWTSLLKRQINLTQLQTFQASHKATFWPQESTTRRLRCGRCGRCNVVWWWQQWTQSGHQHSSSTPTARIWSCRLITWCSWQMTTTRPLTLLVTWCRSGGDLTSVQLISA